jgi:hypothetical protein
LIRVRAVSLNYRDILLVTGRYGFSTPAPDLIPVSDGAGEVAAVGEGVTRFAVGDRVAGIFSQSWLGGDQVAGDWNTTLGGGVARSSPSNWPMLPARTKYLQCTAEHLVARQDSGEDTTDNIIAACSRRDRMRHHGRQHNAPDAATYKSQIARLVALGRWHPLAASERARVSDARPRALTPKCRLGASAEEGPHL